MNYAPFVVHDQQRSKRIHRELSRLLYLEKYVSEDERAKRRGCGADIANEVLLVCSFNHRSVVGIIPRLRLVFIHTKNEFGTRVSRLASKSLEH